MKTIKISFGLWIISNFLFFSFLFLVFVSGFVVISAFASLTVVPVGIVSSAVGTGICAITAGIKKSIINKKRKKHDKLAWLGKAKLDPITVLISKANIYLSFSHDEFLSMC